MKIKILLILIFNIYSISSFAQFYQNNELNYFNENQKSENTSPKITEDINLERRNFQMKNDEIFVKSIHPVKNSEMKLFNNNLIQKCKDLRKSVLIVNQFYLDKLKIEFNINEKVQFKKNKVGMYEIPFYFSDSDKCIFNHERISNIELKTKIMSEIKKYEQINRE